MSDEKILKTNMETNSSSREATTQQVNNVEMPSRSVNINLHIFLKREWMNIYYAITIKKYYAKD